MHSHYLLTKAILIGRIFAFFILPVLAAPAQKVDRNAPANWWPDSTTGLMWTGRDAGHQIKYPDASSYCQNLTLLGYSGWRLPTITELQSVTYLRSYTDRNEFLKHGNYNVATYLDVAFPWYFPATGDVWSSTPAGDRMLTLPAGSTPALAPVAEPVHNSYYDFAYCVRTMEPDLLSLARQANTPEPVASIAALQSSFLLNQAEQALRASQFQQAADLASRALPTFRTARGVGDLGAAEIGLGRYADAITNLTQAHSMDKNNMTVGAWMTLAKPLQKKPPADPAATQALMLKAMSIPAGESLAAQAEEALAKLCGDTCPQVLRPEETEPVIDLATRAVALSPDSAFTHNALGEILFYSGQYDPAVSELSLAVALDHERTTNARNTQVAAKTALKKQQKHQKKAP